MSANLGCRRGGESLWRVYVPIAKVASLWLTSIDCLTATKRGRGGCFCVTTTWQLVPAWQEGEGILLQLPNPPPSLPPKSPVSPRCSSWRRGCNVSRRRFSGHAILWRNWRADFFLSIYHNGNQKEFAASNKNLLFTWFKWSSGRNEWITWLPSIWGCNQRNIRTNQESTNHQGNYNGWM